ncbi:hypothetical protein OAA61_03310 [Candidatus Pelagibacter ubique]|nr:hypothetical protein [Candidatus Pelagibacter ubique]
MKTINLIDNKGYLKIPNIINLEILKKINLKISQIIQNPFSFQKAIDYRKLKKKKERKVLIHSKYAFLSKTDLGKGVKFFSKYTNSVQLKDPLINIPELNKFIFSKKIIQCLKKSFKSSNIYFLYAVIRIHFVNKLPKMDYNFFHLDKTFNNSESSKKIIKFSIPLTLIKNKKINSSEFKVITLNKKHIKKENVVSHDYTMQEELPIKVRKKIFNPKIKSGDCLFFDPVNFFHMAEKPKNIRITFYGVAGTKKNYIAKKTKIIKIYNKDYEQLKGYQKKFASLLTRV